MTIFEKFDTILSALKPSQYRAMWQLYNYDGKKKYHKNGRQSNGGKTVAFNKDLCRMFIDEIDNELQYIRDSLSWQYWIDLTYYIIYLPSLGSDALNEYGRYGYEVFAHNNPIMKKIEAEYSDYISDFKRYYEANKEKAKGMMFTEAERKFPYKVPFMEMIEKAFSQLSKIITSHIGDDTGIVFANSSMDNVPYMEDDTLHMVVDDSEHKIKANPQIKHMYDSLFPENKGRMKLDLNLRPTNELIVENAKTSGISLERIIRGIHLAALLFFSEIKKDVDEAGYIESVLQRENYRLAVAFGQYLQKYLAEGMYTMKTNSKRSFRVGKILAAAVKLAGNTEDLADIRYAAEKYNLVKVSSDRNSSLIIVLSRHPYDLAGMSTDRGWRSCMNLIDGEYRQFVPMSIAGGVLIAYLCEASDTNIEHPLGRVLIKPYIKNGEEISANPINFILQCSMAYGTFYDSYIKQLQKWIDTHWNSKVETSSDQYKLTDMAYHETKDKDFHYHDM